ncbi:MAG: hypothetical protein K5695_00270 [Oscillospiraceae bacterium]|nr:hypothetical protein [Oscillospiraceae bacterium]
MTVSIHSRKSAEALIRSGYFPKNTAVISFNDPLSVAGAEYKPVDYSGVTAQVFRIMLPDLDWYAYPPTDRLQGGMLPDADGLAKFILDAAVHRRDILCQCEYGKSRSAGCAAAILEYYSQNGKCIFSDPRYYPNHLVYDEVLRALRSSKKGEHS